MEIQRFMDKMISATLSADQTADGGREVGIELGRRRRYFVGRILEL
jgi:hypothetical protein